MLPVFCTTSSPSPGAIRSWQALPGAETWSYRHYRSDADWQNWSEEFPDQVIWRSGGYLRLLSRYPQGVRTSAVALLRADQSSPVLLTVQDFELRSGEQILQNPEEQDWKAALVRWVTRQFKPRVLVIGQLLLSGPWGSEGLSGVSVAETANVLSSVAQVLTSQGKYHGVVIKDIAGAEDALVGILQSRGYLKIMPEPVMVMDLRPYSDYRDYLSGLSSKYRVRYRRARKKLKGLRRELLDAEEADRWLPLIYDLHRETRRGAEYRFVALTSEYFAWLWPRAHFHGYFDGAELVGFTTGVGAGQTYFAHYLGLRESYKQSHHLYHNMLFDLLEAALDGQYEELDYGRTATEIKSSVGARPRSLPLLFRSSNALLDRALRAGLKYVYRPADWTQRNPFKQTLDRED